MVSLKKPPQRATRKPVSAPEIAPEPIVVEAAPPTPEPVAAEAQPVSDDEQRPSRGERVPLGAQRQKLAHEDRPGFKRRIFNDEGGRIMAAKAAGYTHVKDIATGSPIKHLVGVAKTGGALTGYLMEIPEEYYYEDMAAKDSVARQFDKDIRRGAGPGTAPGDDGRYVPMKPDGRLAIEIKDSVSKR